MRSFIIAILATYLPVCSPHWAAAGDPFLDAARARHQKVKTLDCTFSITEFIAKNGISKREGRMSPSDLPVEDVTLESTNRVLLDGNKVRYEYNHPQWYILGMGKPSYYSSTYVNDGKCSKFLFPTGFGNDGSSFGVINENTEPSLLRQPMMAPFNYHFRGADPTMSGNYLLSAKSTGTSLPIDGTPCLEYVVTISKDETVLIWVDPARDYSIRRLSKQRLGKVVVRWDVTLEDRPVVGPVPIAWTHSEFNSNGRAFRPMKIQIMECKINQTIPSSEFELEFPEGCKVSDQRNRKLYLVQADGSMREIGPNGEFLDAVVPKPGPSWIRRNTWLPVGLGAALLLLLLAMSIPRRIRRPEGPRLPDVGPKG